MYAAHNGTAGAQSDGGFSLLEVVIAMVILGTMAVAIIGVIMNTQALGVTNRSRVAAANLAAREVDILREEFSRSADAPMNIANQGTVTNPHPLASGVAGQPLRVDGKAYTVERQVAWNITGEGASACSGGVAVKYPTLRVTVSVTWPGMGNTQPVVSRSSIAPRKDDKVLGFNGYVAVRVSDSTGAASVGRTVRVYSAAETRTGVTDTSGCAVVQVNPAVAGSSYSAQVTDASYVDMASSTGPTKLVGIVARGQFNNTTTFTVAAAATLTLRFVTATGAPADPADLVAGQVSVTAAVYSGASGTKLIPVTGTTMVLTGLWPTQYTAFWGSSPTGVPNSPAVISPGGTGTIDVKLPTVTP